MASVLDLVKHYQHAIEKYPNDEQKILKCIDKLFNLKVTVQHLQETGVGRTVNALRKEPGEVGQASRALVSKWKLMVASEESDQETDHNDTTNHNGYGNGKDSDENTRQSHKDDKNERCTYRHEERTKHGEMNGNYSGSKRKYQSSEEEEPGVKKSKGSVRGTYENHKKTNVKVKSEPKTDSESEDESDHSRSDDSESEMSDSTVEEVKVKQEIKSEPEYNKSSKHSSSKNGDNKKDSSSKHSHDSKSSKSSSKQSSSRSKDRHSSEKSSSKESSHSSHKSTKEKESSSEKKHKSDHKEKDKRQKEESKSSKHSSSDKHKSSHTDSSSEKHGHSKEKHSYKTEKNRSSSSSQTDKSEKDKHKSSSEKEIPTDKHKSKDRSSSSKEKHSSSSKDKTKDTSGSSKEKPDSNKNEKTHSSSEKSKNNKNKDKVDDKCENRSKQKSSSSQKNSKSSDKSIENIPKKKQVSQSEDSDDGIDCGSGASFAEALGMISPAKPKKKSAPLKDSISPGNTDLSAAAMLAPSAKLAPLPALEISALPEISPHYKPRPPPKLVPHFTDEEAMSAVISSKNQRTKVYSGNKVIGKIPSLYEMCVQILQEHIDALEYTGGVPYEILKPVIDKATPQQLFILEHFNPYLMEDTDHLWQKFCEKNFRKQKRQEMETWREMYMRCQEEQENKLKSLTENIKIAQEAKKAPIKQTKMAYVDTVVKPPRNIARKQALHGTAHAASASPAARVASLAAAPNVLRGGRAPPVIATPAHFKPKKAPLMAKALQFMRGRKR